MIGKIHSIETFGTVDGPGVRYVVFFQGCPMRCLYCHNPDTWAVSGGKEYTADALLSRMLRHISFYESGGITVTGGEPMMQLDFLTELFEKAKANGIHTCLDTSGIMFEQNSRERIKKIDRLLKATDLVMLDIKHIGDEEHKKLTSHSNKNVLAFAEYLNGKNVKMRIRHVIVPGITDKRDELLRLGQFIGKFNNIEMIEILPYHTMGVVKYKNLGLDYVLKHLQPLTEADAEKALAIVEEGINSIYV